MELIAPKEIQDELNLEVLSDIDPEPSRTRIDRLLMGFYPKDILSLIGLGIQDHYDSDLGSYDIISREQIARRLIDDGINPQRGKLLLSQLKNRRLRIKDETNTIPGLKNHIDVFLVNPYIYHRMFNNIDITLDPPDEYIEYKKILQKALTISILPHIQAFAQGNNYDGIYKTILPSSRLNPECKLILCWADINNATDKEQRMYNDDDLFKVVNENSADQNMIIRKILESIIVMGQEDPSIIQDWHQSVFEWNRITNRYTNQFNLSDYLKNRVNEFYTKFDFSDPKPLVVRGLPYNTRSAFLDKCESMGIYLPSLSAI